MADSQPNLPNFNTTQAEDEIEKHRKVVDFKIIEYPIEVIVRKYRGEDDDEDIPDSKPEFYIPDYQREHTWDKRRQAKFVESVLIGLPIPFLFLAETDDDEGRMEVVDGSQRIRTLDEFTNGKLVLNGLEKLPSLNGFTFEQLPLARQRKFNRSTIRIIALSGQADEETRRDLFERINTGSDALTNMEQRRGILRGDFIRLIEKCAKNELLHTLAPLSESYVKRREREEYVLRFFAYADRYLSFDKSVKDFLDDYVKQMNLSFDEAGHLTQFENMLQFVKAHFRCGFRRANFKTAKRVRFEAISVGVALALKEKPDLVPSPTDAWADSDEFYDLTTSDSSNSKPRVVQRIEYVKNKLLGIN